MEEILKMVGNYGFPIVVAGYLLVRLEPIIRDLQRSIDMQTLIIAKYMNVDVDEIKHLVKKV
ncbi:YvrJ family protein [Desulforamulus aquiferis]|uniref:YvrJ family protein n=1 Tax=Desulforamulus aquiferis TaxID=1397668 RepID=A0AAW7ZFS6_9FIRM|nr:YvrJ family protein [Desulforamulus aquiferis]MDO7787881.1 YvrJ family protein [Desulforamulus aquiferis]